MRRGRAVVALRDHAKNKGHHRRNARAKQCRPSPLTRRTAQLVGNEEPDSHTDCRLRNGHKAADRKIFAKFMERKRCHVLAHGRVVVWDFQLEMETNRALGIDPGEARVGVAISDELGLLAHPVESIPVATINPVERIAALAAEKAIGTIVVGMPRNMDGTYGPAAEKARAFIEKLRARVTCRIVAWDERLTTVSAQRALRDAGRPAKKQRHVIDQAAAQILLQSWLDAQAGPP